MGGEGQMPEAIGAAGRRRGGQGRAGGGGGEGRGGGGGERRQRAGKLCHLPLAAHAAQT